MERSIDRVLTTHVGSLIRPPELREILRAKAHGETIDEAKHTQVLTDSVSAVVRQQTATGVDVISDGEIPKTIRWFQ